MVGPAGLLDGTAGLPAAFNSVRRVVASKRGTVYAWLFRHVCVKQVIIDKSPYLS